MKNARNTEVMMIGGKKQKRGGAGCGDITVSGLVSLYQNKQPEGHYFDVSTMRFFGDRFSNFIVYDGGEINISYPDEPPVYRKVWVLARKRAVSRYIPAGAMDYFDKETGKDYPLSMERRA